MAHPPLFHTHSPTLLALCWGVAATAAIGLAWGTLLALVSQSAGRPPIPVARLGREIIGLLAVMGMAALLAGGLGFYVSRHGMIAFPAALVEAIPANHHDRFMAVWFAHLASYLVGFTGAASLIHRVWKERGRPMVLALYPRNRLGILRAVAIVFVVALIVWWRFLALS